MHQIRVTVAEGLEAACEECEEGRVWLERASSDVILFKHRRLVGGRVLSLLVERVLSAGKEKVSARSRTAAAKETHLCADEKSPRLSSTVADHASATSTIKRDSSSDLASATQVHTS